MRTYTILIKTPRNTRVEISQSGLDGRNILAALVAQAQQMGGTVFGINVENLPPNRI